MQVCVIGSGYVGLVTAGCLADSGNHVTAVDVDAAKVAALGRGECPIFERGLEELLRANLAAGRLRFTTDFASAAADAKVLFIAVGTPGLPDGSADLKIVEQVAQQIAAALRGPAVVVTKSTVPVGTGARIEAVIRERCAHRVSVVSNPEFLKEGTAVDDFVRPDRVIIGCEDAEAGDTVAELYKPFVRNNKPILRMSRAAAELTKYAANAYLAARISFINEIAELCEQVGVDVDEVRRGIGLDARIGQHFLYPGLGYGGSCFPKDVRALASTAEQVGAANGILHAVDLRNRRQCERVFGWVLSRLGDATAGSGSPLSGRRIAVWGLAFKPNTDDVREAPALAVIERLAEAGATVAAHDPRALDNARRALEARRRIAGRVTFCRDAYTALDGADGLLTATEWMEYRSPDFDDVRRRLRQPLIFDGRNLYDPAMMGRYGFEYYSIGRPRVAPRAEAAGD
ncbi:MAG: UDP-glucose/GDP-mannose dehydrogenase family protein [Phycisphaerae bacterium]|nr:UDP-glucose/GDP-mannose dehydrogenase family protein [Phycisphaerae bacterium]MCZ2400895.1 UDP-glucose/GDP-mannose dehydrogenase family protein [Phycisphaerae bacterium]